MRNVVLDTCALLFWTHEPDRLGATAAEVLEGLGGEARGLVSSASFWEIALKARAGRLDLGMTPAEYLARVNRMPLAIEDVGASLWLDSVALPWKHQDPVDRLVVALAARHDADVLTCDRAIREAYPRVTW